MRSTGTPLNIEILVVNQTGKGGAASMAQMNSGRSLAVVQDSSSANVWNGWDVEYRDVRILDSSNRVAAVFNLSNHDLSSLSNREALKELLVSAAQLTDTDSDELPDHWESQFLRGLSHGGNDDPDGDQASNFAELALGSDPFNRWSRPSLTTSINEASRFTITFPRWAGTLARYGVEGSTNLVNWSADPTTLRITSRNLYDGTGRSEVSYSFNKTVVTQPFGFLRLNVEPMP